MEKVVLAFSGGLDTTVCVKLLEEEYNYEVVTACVDVGQPAEELQKSQNSADKINTGKHYIIDAKDEFAKILQTRLIQANIISLMQKMNLQMNTLQEESRQTQNMKDTH